MSKFKIRSFIAFALFSFGIILIPLSANQHQLALLAATATNVDSCDKKSLSSLALGKLARIYFQIPGLAEHYIKEGGSFIYVGVNGAICEAGTKQFNANQKYVFKSINRGIALGESVNSMWIDYSGYDGFYPIHFAVMQNRLDIIKYLVEKGADLSLKTSANAKMNFTIIAYDIPNMTALQLAEKYANNTSFNKGIVTTEILAYLKSKTA